MATTTVKQWTVLEIVNHRCNQKGTVSHYCARWDTGEVTWEAEHHFASCDLVKATYWQKQQQQKDVVKITAQYSTDQKNLLNATFAYHCARLLGEDEEEKRRMVLVLDAKEMNTCKHLVEYKGSIFANHIFVPNHDSETVAAMRKTQEQFGDPLSLVHVQHCTVHRWLAKNQQLVADQCAAVWLDYNGTLKTAEDDLHLLFSSLRLRNSQRMLFGLTVSQRNWKPNSYQATEKKDASIFLQWYLKNTLKAYGLQSNCILVERYENMIIYFCYISLCR